MLTITHTHADGTTLDGSRKGDGVWETCKANGWRFSRDVGIYIRGSRDHDADRARINRTADALRAAGHEVTVEIDDTPRATVDRETDRAERADARADRYAERAGKAAAESEARRAASDAISDHMPFGEPIKVGHHSERKHRRAFEKIDAHTRKAIDAADRARDLTYRAEAVGHNLEHRQDPRVTMRRVERLEAEARDVARRLSGYRNNLGDVFTAPEPGGDYHEKLTRRAAQLSEEITYWRAELAKLAEADAFVPWGPEHFRKADRVNVGGSWYPVIRVNRKSVTIPPLIGMGSTENRDGVAWSWTDTVPWDKIAGRRRDGFQLDTPNGEAWPVDLAIKVARWTSLAQYYGTRDGHDDASRRKATHVRWAQRIAHRLDMGAAQTEVTAHEPPTDDTDARRVLAAAYVDVFDRLTAGETSADILADLPAVPEVVPAWVMPDGEPQRAPVRDLLAGDIIAGWFDRGFAGSGERLVRAFVGPVAAVVPHEGADYSGERFVGWWTVRLTTGEVREFRPWDLVAAHRAEAGDAPPVEVEPAAPAIEPEQTASVEAVSGEAEPRNCRKAQKRVIPFNCKQDAGHNGKCTPYTLRLTTRDQRGCCCPFSPGCAGSPCRSAGTYWQIRNLVRERYEWATATPSAFISEDMRAENLVRIARDLGDARAALRSGRPAQRRRDINAEPVTVTVSRGVCPQCGTGTGAAGGAASVVCAAPGCAATVLMRDVVTFNPARPYPFPPMTAVEPNSAAVAVNPWDDLLAAHLATA